VSEETERKRGGEREREREREREKVITGGVLAVIISALSQ